MGAGGNFVTGLLRRSVIGVCLALLAGCVAPAGSQRDGGSWSQDAAQQSAPARISRTLIMAGRTEAPSVASRPLRTSGLAARTVSRLFNAGLALRDGEGTFHPYLAEALPELNTGTWFVSPDGRMETTYRLRANLVWHDGAVLSAEDFVFAHEVYTHPESGMAASSPIGMMDQVLAPDARTVVIRWRTAFVDAGNLDAGNGSIANAIGFPPLPRHLLEAQLRDGNFEAFVGLPFWSNAYVGLGPYKMDRWEAGAYFEGVAFDRHVLGRPKIERVRMLFIPDFNTSVANMLAGEAHITVDDSIRFQQALVLRREWGPRQGGTVLVYPALWRHTYFQLRAELARPAAFLDVRVRKALMHLIDKQSLSDALFEGEGILTDTPIPPTSSAFAEVDRVATKYPYDARRAGQLMAEAGYARGADGIWAHPTAGRFAFGLDTFQSPQNENEMHIMADTWRQAGFDVTEHVLAAPLASDQQLRDTRPGLVAASVTPGEITLADHASALIPSAQNRWIGSNRGGWSNTEFDRLAQQFNSTLSRPERGALLVQMAKVFTEDAAVISLYFNPTTTAFTSALRGPKPSVPEGDTAWDIHTWEWVS